MSIIKHRQLYCMLSFIFVVISFVTTQNFLSDNAASGSFYFKGRFYYNIIQIAVFLIVVYIMWKREQSYSENNYQYYIYIYLTLFYLPLISYSCVIKTSAGLLIYSSLYILFMVFLCYIKPIRIVTEHSNISGGFRKIKNVKSEKKYWVLFILTILTILILTWYFTGFHLSLNFDGVYRKRALYKDKSNFYFNVLKNVFGWFLVPVFLMNELNNKRRITSVLMFFMGVLLFTWGKDKVYLFIIFMVVVIYFIKDININKLCVTFLFGMISGLIVSIVLNIITDSNFFYMVVMRRLFITPQDVSNKYFEFFMHNKKLFWRQDVFLIDKLFTPVYDKSYFKLIAESAYGNLVDNPCTGALAESFTQLGWGGLIIYPLITKFFLGLLNKCMSNFDNRTKLLVVFNFTFLIIDSGITTSDFIIEYTLGCFLICVLNKNWHGQEKISYETNINYI